MSSKTIWKWTGFVFLFCLPLSLTAGNWRPLTKGLAFRDLALSAEQGTIQLLKIDLAHYRLGLLQASGQPPGRAFLDQMVIGTKAVAAMNASFFDVDGKAMGLTIDNSQEKSSLRRTSWGVFQIIDGTPSIIHTRNYRKNGRRSLAIQTGPRLVIAGKTPSFQQQRPARRSAICITPQKEVVWAVAYEIPITLASFAQALKPHCRDALNLDGGSSTQFYLKTEKLTKKLPGREPIPNALAIFPR